MRTKRLEKIGAVVAFSLATLVYGLMLFLGWYTIIADLFYNELSLVKKIVGWIGVPFATVMIVIFEIVELIPWLKLYFRKEE